MTPQVLPVLKFRKLGNDKIEFKRSKEYKS